MMQALETCHPVDTTMSSQAPLALNHDINVYLAVSLTPTSIYTNTPIALSEYPSVAQVGNVGELPDVKLLSVPKGEWQNINEDILQQLRKDSANIVRVDVQEPKARKKRGGFEDGHDEL